MSAFLPSLARKPQARPHPKGCAGMAGRGFAGNAGDLRAYCGHGAGSAFSGAFRPEERPLSRTHDGRP